MALKVIQQNFNKSPDAHYEIRKVMVDNESPVICLLQEVRAYKGKLLGMPSNAKYFVFGENPRAAIIADDDVQIWPLPEYSDRDLVVCMVKSDTTEAIFCSLYSDRQIKDFVINPKLDEVSRKYQHLNSKDVFGSPPK